MGVQYAMLDWNQVLIPNYFESISLYDKDEQPTGQMLHSSGIDIIIGSDLIWQSAMVEGLMNTLNLLFKSNSKVVFYHCYIERSLELHLTLLKEYGANDFIVEYVGKEVTDRLGETTYQ